MTATRITGIVSVLLAVMTAVSFLIISQEILIESVRDGEDHPFTWLGTFWYYGMMTLPFIMTIAGVLAIMQKGRPTVQYLSVFACILFPVFFFCGDPYWIISLIGIVTSIALFFFSTPPAILRT